MPNRLRGLRLSKVDLVDRGAQGPHATVRLYKRDYSESESAPGTVREQNHDKEISVGKQLTEELRKNLPEEVAQYLEALESDKETLETQLSDAQEKLNSPEGEGEGVETPEPALNKSELPEEVRSLLEKRENELNDLRKRAEDAETIAKAERDKRLEREWTDRLSTLDGLNFEIGKVAKQFKSLADKDADFANELVETLKAINEQAKTADLFGEVGKRGPAEGSAEAKIEGVVKALREADPKLSEPEAWQRALDQNPELYEQYVTERS